MVTCALNRGLYLLIVPLLLSCVPVAFPTMPATISPTIAPTTSPTVSPPTSPTSLPTLPPSEILREILKLDEQCPHVCWQKLNPGVTSSEEARDFLLGHPKNFHVVDRSDTHLEVTWGNFLNIFVKFEDGL